MTFSDDNSDYDGHGQLEGEYSDCDPIFRASCTLSETNLLTKGLNDTLLDFNMSRKTSCTRRFQTKRLGSPKPRYLIIII